MDYKPLKTKELPGYMWHCAFADCTVKKYILPCMIYDRLSGYRDRESVFYRGKWYETQELALEALSRSFKKVEYDIELSLINLPKDQRIAMLPKLEYVTKTGKMFFNKKGDSL